MKAIVIISAVAVLASVASIPASSMIANKKPVSTLVAEQPQIRSVVAPAKAAQISASVQTVVVSSPTPAVVPVIPSDPYGNLSTDPSEQVALMTAAGIPAADQPSASYIIEHESLWRIGAILPTQPIPRFYGLCGLGDKMSTFGADYKTNPVVQMTACNRYVVVNYGTWASAAAGLNQRHVF